MIRMSILSTYRRGLRAAQSITPEQRAITPTASFLRTLGREAAVEDVRGMEAATGRLRTESALANERRDIRAAKRDFPVALGVGAANVALQGVSAWDRAVMSAKEEQDRALEDEKYNLIQRAIEAWPKRYTEIMDDYHKSIATPEPAPDQPSLFDLGGTIP